MTVEKFNQLISAHSEFYAAEPETGHKHVRFKVEKAYDRVYTIFGDSDEGWYFYGDVTQGELFEWIQTMQVWVKYD